jgi:hypothetical protein
MAAPIVAGEAALIHAAFPSLSNRKIADHIERHNVQMDGPNPNKRIDVGAALTSAPGDDSTSTVQVNAPVSQ